MPSNYPAALDDLSNPSGSQRLSVGGGGHAALHTNTNDAIEAIQAALGTYPGVGAVLPFGAVGNGVVDDRAALVLGDADARPMLLDAGKTYRVGSNLTLSGKIISNGGMLRPDAGVTITLAQAPDAGRYQVFDLSAGGTVTFAANATGCGFGEWWGMSTASVDNKGAAQAAGNACAAGSIPLEIGPGIFEWDSSNAVITVPVGGRFELRGAGPQTVLRRKTGSVSSDFDSLLLFYTSGTGDVESISIHDFSIDGNGAGNPLPGADAFEWEHCAEIRISPQTGGYFKNVEIYNIWGKDPIADGIWINEPRVRNVHIHNVTYTDRTRSRSDITFSYFPEYARINDCDLTKLETEPLATPSGTPLFQVDNVRCSTSLDLEGRENVRFEMTNVNTQACVIWRCAGYWKGGSIRSSTTTPRINYPSGFEFEKVRFLYVPDGTNTVYGYNIYHTTLYQMGLIFRNCRFEIDSALAAGSLTAPYALHIQPRETIALNPDRAIEMIDCWFDSRFQRSWTADRPGILINRNCDYGGTVDAFSFINGASRESRLTIDGGRWARVTGLFGNVGMANVVGSLTFKNIEIGVEHANFTALASLTGVTVRSDRLIWVTAAPTNGGVIGDRAKLASPTAAAIAEWMATTNHATAATWRAATTLA